MSLFLCSFGIISPHQYSYLFILSSSASKLRCDTFIVLLISFTIIFNFKIIFKFSQHASVFFSHVVLLSFVFNFNYVRNICFITFSFNIFLLSRALQIIIFHCHIWLWWTITCVLLNLGNMSYNMYPVGHGLCEYFPKGVLYLLWQNVNEAQCWDHFFFQFWYCLSHTSSVTKCGPHTNRKIKLRFRIFRKHFDISHLKLGESSFITFSLCQ